MGGVPRLEAVRIRLFTACLIYKRLRSGILRWNFAVGFRRVGGVKVFSKSQFTTKSALNSTDSKSARTAHAILSCSRSFLPTLVNTFSSTTASQRGS